MTSKIVVNNIESDSGISSVTFNSNVVRGGSNLHSTGLALGAGSTIGAVTGVTTYYGDGSQLTGISAGVSLANGADNRVVTATGAAALNGEANLTFSGSELVADSSMITAQNTGAGSGASKIQLQPYGTDGYINCTASGNLYTRMGTGFTTRTQIDSNGNFTVSSGNLVIGTAGKGIDFSATSDATHTAVTSGAQPSTDSEVLTDYEHGTWTPRLRAYDHAGGAGWNTMKYTDGTEVTGTGRYVRMGNHVWAGF